MTILGILLVLVVIAVAVVIGQRADRNVRLFDESKHESFLGSDMRGK